MLIHVLEMTAAVVIGLSVGYIVARMVLARGLQGVARDLLDMTRWLERIHGDTQKTREAVEKDPATTKAIVDRVGAVESRVDEARAAAESAEKASHSVRGKLGAITKQIAKLEGAPADLDADSLFDVLSGQTRPNVEAPPPGRRFR